MSGTTSGLKVRPNIKIAAILKISKYLNRFILTSDMERPSEINPQKLRLMLMTSLITSQCDVKVGWIQEMDTYSAYMSKSEYMESYWFSNKSNINIIYNISVVTITITMSVILANFGKYAISDCPFITCQNYHFGKYVGWSCLLLAKIWFWQVCSLVVFVCLFVCLFVRKFHKISRTSQPIITKLAQKQALVHDSCKFVGQECRLNS